jgi:hypothetical protein
MVRVHALHTVAVLGLAAYAMGCQRSSTQRQPFTPGTPTAPAIFKLEVTGPARVAPGETVAYTATGILTDGTKQDVTLKAGWSAIPSSVLTISNPGQVTGHATGDATLVVSLPEPGIGCCTAGMTLLVLPADTYRLVGTVLESNLGVDGATVTVLSGTGAGLSATTDANGNYRLYGVAGAIRIKVSKPGYDDIVKTLTVTQNDTLDFPEAHQTAPIPSLAGSYSLTLSADPGCPTTPVAGLVPLPNDFRQPRTYAASLTQNGPELTVRLTDPGMIPNRNHFRGRVGPDGIDFQVNSWSYYYYGNPELIAEQLSGTQQFEFGGQLHAQRSSDAIAGHLNGTIEVISRSPASSGMCIATSHQITMTHTARPSRAR